MVIAVDSNGFIIATADNEMEVARKAIEVTKDVAA